MAADKRRRKFLVKWGFLHLRLLMSAATEAMGSVAIYA